MAHSISQQFKGTGVALVTPFNSDYSINFDALKKLVRHQINGGTNYLVILGTTGETSTLNSDEKQSILDCIRTENNGALPLVLGVGGNNTMELADKLKKQDFEGISAVLSVSPYYNKPNQKGIVQHYQYLAEASPLPLILYNVPGRTGSNVGIEATLELAEHANILGTKEASGNFSQCMEIIKHKPANFSVISGDDAFTLPFISMGMDGVISVIANAYPKEFSTLIQLALNSQFAEAREIHYQLLEAMNVIFADGSPSGIKVILKALNICDTTVRMPLHDVSETVYQQLLNSMLK